MDPDQIAWSDWKPVDGDIYTSILKRDISRFTVQSDMKG